MKIFLIFMVVLALLTPFNICAQSNPALDFNELDSFVNKELSDWQVPGLALSIVKDGKVIYQHGYGVKSLKSKEQVTTGTLFSIASATKSFTATAAAMLVDEEKIGWDIPLKTYFPDFKLYDKAATEKVTLKDLMSHRSGIPRQKFYSLIAPQKRLDTRYDMQYFQPGSDFRSSFLYCNETFAVAGDMIAERAGTTWEELIRKRIFIPLGMKNSILSSKDLKGKDYAVPYIQYTDESEEMSYHNADMLGGAGAIISNAEDMSEWLIFNLNKGKINDSQLLSTKSLALIQSPVLSVPGSSGNKEIINQCYGTGWFSDAYRGYKRVHHGGVLYGFTSLVSMLPTENIGIVILANMNGTFLTSIIEGYVYDHLLQMTPVDWNQRYEAREKKLKEYYKELDSVNDTTYKPETKTSVPIESYCGEYVSKGYGTMNIRKSGDSLMTTLLGVDCPLRHHNDDVFDLYHPVERENIKLSFIIDSKKKVHSLQIELSPGLKPVIYRKDIS